MAKTKTLRRVEIVFANGAMNPDIHVEWDVQILDDAGQPDPDEPVRGRRATVKVADLDTPVNIPGLGNRKLRALIETHHAECTVLREQLEADKAALQGELEQTRQQLEQARAEAAPQP